MSTPKRTSNRRTACQKSSSTHDSFAGFAPLPNGLLDSKGVAYVEHDATFSPDLRQEMIGRANGRMTFPQIFIDDIHVGGCDELHALERAGKLDPMLAGGLSR
jgi:glutaredoxin 3